MISFQEEDGYFLVTYFGLIKIMNNYNYNPDNLVDTSFVCIYFDHETLVDGQGSCMLWDDAPFKCIGWLSNDSCCIDYEPWEVIGLEKG
jgi:hypothetical protein